MVCRQGLGYVHRNPVLCMEKYGILHGDLSGRLTGDQRRALRACSLDGANTWQRFRYITWPQLQPTTFFVTIILTINCFKVYDIVYMLAGGSTGVLNESAIVLVYHIYEEAFRNWNLGYASAVAMVLFLIVLAITLVQFRGEKKYAN